MAVLNFLAIIYAASYCLFSGVWVLAGLILIQGVFIWVIELKSNLIEELLLLVRAQEDTMNRQNEVMRKYLEEK